MHKRNYFYVILLILLGGVFPAISKADSLVGPQKRSCEDIFKDTYALLEKGKNPHLMDPKACPVSHKLLTWIWLLKHDKHATFEDYRAFLRENEHWPLMNKIQEGGEHAISTATAPEQVLSFFQHRKPRTAVGMIHYVKALLRLKKSDEAIKALRKFWRERNFNAANERFFYKSFRKHLTSEDHQHRLDRLAIEGNYYGLKRMVRRVSKRAQRIIEANIALVRSQSVADFRIKKLVGHEKHNIGVIYNRIKWRLKKGKRKEALDLFLTSERAGYIKRFAPQWFKYRYYFSRLLLQQKRYKECYDVLIKHSLNPKILEELTDYAAAEWFLGWVSLRFLKAPIRARRHFENMLHHVKTPISRAKAYYWLGRTESVLKNREKAETFYGKAGNFPHVFYGQEALKALGKKPKVSLKGRAAAVTLTPQDRELRTALALLHRTNPDDIHLRNFLIHMARQCPAGHQEDFIQWMGEKKLDRWIVLCSKISGRKGSVLLKRAYPVGFFDKEVSSKANLSKVLLNGLIRQESGFDVGIKSPAGACGMMQLMPKVAKKLCSKLKIPFRQKALTQDARYNIRIGSYFLDTLLGQFSGDAVLALASYNAGETAVRKWIREYGDPREKKVDTLDWIESIPYSETRTYVMRIFETFPIYEGRLRG